ncbi:MAG TPA: MarR family transcriptional regulator [Candidatus Saccharimonadales bacterium]|nr:MarR family transcriptional regulator [Candidatus Saccharimonadales bacterium]
MLKDLPRYECLLQAGAEFPDLDPSATEAFLNLLHTGDEAFRVLETHLANHDISHGRFGVLMALWAHERRGCALPPLTPAELAERTSVTRATMTGLIDTLERDGLVRRGPATSDRRMTIVQATPEGLSLINQILPRHFQMMAGLMAPLSDVERKTLVGLLQKIVARAVSIAPPGGEPATATAAR